mgnify:CR=1 FL=1
MNAIMTSRQAAELDFAFERNGYTADDVKKLSSGNLLARLLPVVKGNAEVKIVRRWDERDGIIYFSVTSNGMTGKEWVKHFESKGIKVSDCAKQVLLSKDFKPSKKGTVYNIAVIKGEFFSDDNRITSKIREEADRRKMTKPNAEVACLIRDLFTDEEIKVMDLYWIVAMHEPIKDSDGYPGLLSAGWDDDESWLSACYGLPDGGWAREGGFAFVASPQ